MKNKSNKMKIKKVEDFEIIQESKDEMMNIYNKYGFDIHSIPSDIQSSLNQLIKDFIKLQNKLKKK